MAPPRMRTAVRGNLDGQCVRELATEPLPQGAPYLLSSPPSAGREGGLATALGAADSPARGRKTMAGGSAAVTPDACFSQVAIPVTNTGYVWIRSSAAEVEPIDRRISICRGRRSSRRLGDFLLTIEFPLAVLDFLCRQADRYCNSPASRMGPGSSAEATARSCAAPARFRGPVTPALASGPARVDPSGVLPHCPTENR